MANFFAFIGRVWELVVRRVDSYLLSAALATAGIGLVTLFSATDQSVARVTSQAASLCFALVLMWIVANIPPQQLARKAAVPLYAVTVPCSARWP
jgi:rod shape determining protein RodA